MTRAIAITQQGENTLFLIGSYQATLHPPSGRRGWRADYFKGSHQVFSSNSEGHPIMPVGLSDKARAQLIVEKVIGNLHANLPVAQVTIPDPVSVKPTKKQSKRKTKKISSPSEALEDLLSQVDDNWTIRIPSGKPAALRVSKVQICDSNGDVACEIPYPVYKNVCCIH